MEKQQRLDELADFLRTRRARLRPEDIDFPAGFVARHRDFVVRRSRRKPASA